MDEPRWRSSACDREKPPRSGSVSRGIRASRLRRFEPPPATPVSRKQTVCGPEAGHWAMQFTEIEATYEYWSGHVEASYG
jgi:hypothetical protein